MSVAYQVPEALEQLVLRGELSTSPVLVKVLAGLASEPQLAPLPALPALADKAFDEGRSEVSGGTPEEVLAQHVQTSGVEGVDKAKRFREAQEAHSAMRAFKRLRRRMEEQAEQFAFEAEFEDLP